jgi:hypothetical protein
VSIVGRTCWHAHGATSEEDGRAWPEAWCVCWCLTLGSWLRWKPPLGNLKLNAHGGLPVETSAVFFCWFNHCPVWPGGDASRRACSVAFLIARMSEIVQSSRVKAYAVEYACRAWHAADLPGHPCRPLTAPLIRPGVPVLTKDKPKRQGSRPLR